MRRTTLLLLLLAASVARQARPDVPPPATRAAAQAGPDAPVVWISDFEQALGSAVAELRPVFVLFTSPGCGWCTRLKQTTLQDAGVLHLLRQFVTVQIDVSEDEQTAAAYGVTGVPLVVVLSSRGSVQVRLPGYLSADELQPLLRQALNPASAAKPTPLTDGLLRLFASGPLPSERWPDVALALAEERARDRMLAALLALQPPPLAQLAALLDDPRLAVRIGAIELLEELTGTNHGFDPWRTAEQLDANREAAGRFLSRPPTEGAQELFLAFDTEQFAAYVQDLISDNRPRALRATRMLQRGGVNTIQALYDHLAANPALPPDARRAISELQYVIYLGSHSKEDGESWAHRLVAGSLDVRLKAVADLCRLETYAPPILKDFLADPNPLIREAAVEALAKTGRAGQIVPLFAKHLETERNREVLYRVLTECGRFRTKSALALLLQWIGHENEDLAIASIQSVGKLRTPDAEAPLLPGLRDPRWRVRLATLETMHQLEYKSHPEALLAMLKDADAFVRFKAVETVASAAKGGATKALEEAFHADDALKPAVIEAWSDLRTPIPAAMIAALEQKPPHIVAASLAAMRKLTPDVCAFAVRCAEHPDADVAATAIRLLAKHALTHADAQRVTLRSLASDKTEHVKAALHALDLERDEDAEIGATIREPTPVGADDSPAMLGLLLKVFGADARTAAAEPPKPPSVPADAAFADFGLTPKGASDAGSGASLDAAASRGLIETALIALMRTHADTSVRDLAMGHLLVCGRPEALSPVQTRLPEATVAERQRYAYALRDYPGEQALPLLRALLRDPSSQVRTAAASGLMANAKKAPQRAGALLEEIARPGAALQPVEAYDYAFANLSEAGAALVAPAAALLEAGQPAAVRLYGLLVAAVIAQRGLLPAIEPLLTHADPVLRRAAWHALARTDRAAALGRLDEIRQDSSELVREVILALANQSPSDSRKWNTYFDAATIRPARLPWSYTYSGDRSSKLTAELAAAVTALAQEASPPLRAKSYFSLLANRVTVDLNELVAALDLIPDQEAAGELAADFLEQNLGSLGARFRILLPYVKRKKDQSEWFMRRLTDKFPDVPAEGESAEIADLTWAPRPTARREGPQLAAIDVSAPAAAAGLPPEERPVTLLFFTTSGCGDCARVKEMLPELRRLFGGLTVQIHDLRDVDAMRLNEALAERFGVSMRQRLVAPALFTCAGFLIRNEIDPAALAHLLARSTAADGGSDAWHRMDEAVAAQADARIVRRHEVFHLSAVVLAALADGINPCAFATIVFLLSYLQVTRRTPSQIFRIGLAFIAGVFATYFLLGMGLMELVTRLEILQRLGRALTYGLAACALVIAGLSVRDGLLCLRGRMGDMTLQLPLVLKRQIHSAIRVGARQSHFVLAAGVVGATVSVLELACTGQVYAPTILYILKTGRESGRALGLLLVYNIAFVLPLLVVFLFACRGLGSDRLQRALVRHAATVKFATAILFIALVAFLLFGQHLL